MMQTLSYMLNIDMEITTVLHEIVRFESYLSQTALNRSEGHL